MKKIIAIVILLGGSAAGYYYYTEYGKEDLKPEIKTAIIGRGNIREVVKATGTLEAKRTVQVGSQVGGVVKALHADFNSIVRENQVIAELDPELLKVEVAIQKANINQRNTDIENQEVQLTDAERNLTRQRQLAEQGLANAQTVEQAELTVRQRKASILNARSQLVSAEASLNRAETNLSYTIIKSPVTGVVINRVVDVGQAVSASQNVAQFFTIATDLTELKLSAGVDEAEVGKVRAGMTVEFQVDSYKGQTFTGTVYAVRLNATNQNNVVTYPVWIEVPNNDLKLKPSMTATLDIIVSTANNVVRIPSTALRFKPNSETYKALGAPEPTANQGRVLRDDGTEQAQAGGPGVAGAGAPGAAQPGAPGATPGQPGAGAQPTNGQPNPRADNGRSGQDGQNNRQAGRGNADGGDRPSGRGGDRTGSNRQPGAGGGTQGFGRQSGVSPEERQRRMEEFMRGRGAGGAGGASGRGGAGGGNSQVAGGQGGRGGGGRGRQPANAGGDTRDLADRDAEKIDDLFPERVPIVTPGQVWTWDEAKKELRPHSVWWGISDGAFSELVRGDLQVGQVIVTSVILPQPKMTGQPGSLFGNPNQMRGGGMQPGGGPGGGGAGGRGAGGAGGGGGGGGGGRGGGR